MDVFKNETLEEKNKTNYKTKLKKKKRNYDMAQLIIQTFSNILNVKKGKKKEFCTIIFFQL